MKYINKYTFDSNLLHEECKKLYKKPHKLLITHEVLYILNNGNNNNSNNKTIYEKILNLLGCY